MKIISSSLFTWRRVVILSAAFVALFIVIQRLLRYVCGSWIAFDCPNYWPVSIFTLHFPTLISLAIAVCVLIAFFIFLRVLEAKRYDFRLSVAFGIVLIAGTTLIQGIDAGYYAPIAGDAQTGVLVPYSANGQEYYHDAMTITDPADFLKRFNEIQPTLHRHAHTHPPGAVLIFYYLQKLLGDPALIAILIMLVSTIVTALFFYRLLLTGMSDDTAGYMVFLLMLLPAVQIYYLATIDAIIASLLMGTLYLFCFGKRQWSAAVAAVLLAASFLLTFVSLFILPVLAGFDLIVRRSLRRSFVIVGIVVLIHVLIYFLTGYNAFDAFLTASKFENPNGFMLFVDPANYLFTRFEDVAEIVFFLGPFLLILCIKGLKDIRSRPLNILTVLACVTLMGMFVSGAWRTGETARACAFMYPFLLFPVGHYLEDSGTGESERTQLASLVFLQAVAMQVAGNYFW